MPKRKRHKQHNQQNKCAKRFPGLLITFEKTAEGLGGTTQALRLLESLKKAGIEAIYIREPGGTQLGERIRELLLDTKMGQMSSASELFLFEAARAQLYKEVLKPALKAGKVIIADRFVDSTLVYQGSARGWKTYLLWQLHHIATGSLIPDLTIVLDGTPHRQRSQNDRIEAESDSFHRKLKEGMLHLASKGGRYALLNANTSVDELADKIFGLVKERFPLLVKDMLD